MDRQTDASQSERRHWMGILARSRESDLLELWRAFDARPEFAVLRAPEVGGVMVRGRMGGTGAPFNLGEMAVTRCSLVLAGGQVGHAYVQGRSKKKAETAALVDALMQTDCADAVRRAILDPLAEREAAQRDERARKAAATKVDFLTLVRGED